MHAPSFSIRHYALGLTEININHTLVLESTPHHVFFLHIPQLGYEPPPFSPPAIVTPLPEPLERQRYEPCLTPFPFAVHVALEPVGVNDPVCMDERTWNPQWPELLPSSELYVFSPEALNGLVVKVVSLTSKSLNVSLVQRLACGEYSE